MSEHEHGQILDHEYDGIREYDNPTPGWWHVLLLVTVFFSVLYVMFWHFSPLSWTIHEAHENAVVAEYARIFGDVGDLTPDEPTIVRFMGDEKMLAVARSRFIAVCANCHGANGGGTSQAPNLTDESYIHIRNLTDVYDVLSRGRTGSIGQMPAWMDMDENMRIILSSYVATLRGRNAPGGRQAEGETIPPWPALPASPPAGE